VISLPMRPGTSLILGKNEKEGTGGGKKEKTVNAVYGYYGVEDVRDFLRPVHLECRCPSDRCV